jgi:hypothetical protein
VITLEDWISIKNLNLKDYSLESWQISKLLRISRNTVKKAFKRDSPPEYYIRESNNNLNTAPFKDYIDELIMLKKLKGSSIK